jgi:hypothetical protein
MHELVFVVGMFHFHFSFDDFRSRPIELCARQSVLFRCRISFSCAFTFTFAFSFCFCFYFVFAIARFVILQSRNFEFRERVGASRATHPTVAPTRHMLTCDST